MHAIRLILAAAVCALTLLLTACIPGNVVHVPESLATVPADAGLVFGSVADENHSLIQSKEIWLRRVGSTDRVRLKLQHDELVNVPLDWEQKEDRGVVFAVRLAPGRYEIHNFHLYIYTSLSTTTINAKEDFSIPFDVEPGKATYVGEFKAYAETSKGPFGVRYPIGGHFVLTDRLERDRALLEKRGEITPDTQVVPAVADVVALGVPILAKPLPQE